MTENHHSEVPDIRLPNRLAIDPSRLSGGAFADRLEVLIEAVLGQEGTRLPGERRFEAREAAASGVTLTQTLHDEPMALTDR